MRRTPFAVLFCILTLGGCVMTENIRPPQPMTAAPSSITVMSFNIRLGLGPEDPKAAISKMRWGRNLPAVLDAIRAEDADIVSLQEVAGSQQAREIAQTLGMNVTFIEHGGDGSASKWWGVAILSKHPIVSSRTAQISWGRGDTRQVVIATVNVGGRTLDAVAVHKDKDLKDGRSIHEILKAISPPDVPTLLIGDFNITPEDKRLAPLAARFIDTGAVLDTASAKEVRKRGTFAASKRRIDYVFADKAHFTVKAARLGAAPHRKASDHIAYIADLALVN